jgi:hypothetical protein
MFVPRLQQNMASIFMQQINKCAEHSTGSRQQRALLWQHGSLETGINYCGAWASFCDNKVKRELAVNLITTGNCTTTLQRGKWRRT